MGYKSHPVSHRKHCKPYNHKRRRAHPPNLQRQGLNWRPDLAAEFNEEKNGFSAEQIIFGSGNSSTWWICKKGHEWQSECSARIRDAGYRKCALNGTSKIEEKIREALILSGLIKGIPDNINHKTEIILSGVRQKIQVDITGITPSGQKIAVEYDGCRWHIDKIQVDTEKTIGLLKEGFIVIRIRDQYQNRERLPFLDLTHERFSQIHYLFTKNDKHFDLLMLEVAQVIISAEKKWS